MANYEDYEYWIPARMKIAREVKGMPQKKLASLTDIDQSHISRYENGKTLPNICNLVKLCMALDVTADYLLGAKSD